MLSIRLQAIVTFDDGNTPTAGPSKPASAVGLSWGDYVKKLVDEANDVYQDQNVDFRLRFEPTTDVAMVSSTALNRDDPEKPPLDLNGNGERPHEYARQTEAWKYPGRAVVFFRYYDSSVNDHSAFSTGGKGAYIVLAKEYDENGQTLAHELGHFFHLGHTFSKEPKTEKEAGDMIQAWLVAQDDPKGSVDKGADVFDGDSPAVGDTPADPGAGLFGAMNGSRCAKSFVRVTVKFTADALKSLPPHVYTIKPDLTNIMSYFNWKKDPKCPTHRTFSPDQKAVMKAALRTGSRYGLLHVAAMRSDDNGKVYFFRDDRYLRYDIGNDRADENYPKRITTGWPGLWDRHIDAAAIWPDGRCYFFKGDEYVKYDRENSKVFKDYPKKIADEWKGVWKEDLDAVLVLDKKTAWFFKGSECQKYDIDQDKAVGDRLPIASHWKGVWGYGIDAAVPWNNGKVYFFKGDQYARYDQSKNVVDQDNHRCEGFWPTVWPKGIDAAVVWNDDTIRFVRGSDYMTYSILGDEVNEGYPRPLKKISWKHFPWINGFDAAAVWNNGKAYVFKGSQYLRIDLEKQAVDEDPRPISNGWEGIGDAPLDAVVLWNNGMAYFFRGDHYFQVDPDKKKAISGPLKITEFWKGIFASNLDAAIALWPLGKAYFFKGDEYIRYDIKKDRADEGYPAGIRGRAWPGLVWPEAAG